jgi:hypothetical protein
MHTDNVRCSNLDTEYSEFAHSSRRLNLRRALITLDQESGNDTDTTVTPLQLRGHKHVELDYQISTQSS